MSAPTPKFCAAVVGSNGGPIVRVPMTFTTEAYARLIQYREHLRAERPDTHVSIGKALDEVLKTHPHLFTGHPGRIGNG